VSAIHHHHHLDYHNAVTPQGDAVSGLAEDVGKALLLFAERLRAEHEATAGASGVSHATRPKAGLGRTQQQVLDALAENPEGLTSAQVAGQVGKQPTNTPRMLKALAERGLVSASEGTPTVWRAATEDE
jgi:hypothetical protein